MEVKLAQMKLEDGITIVEAESFEPDFSVGIVTADGIVPMPVGEYTLEDGKIVVIEVEGIIKEVKDAVKEEAPMPEEEAPMPEAEVEVEVEAEVQPKRIVESVSKETFFAEIEKLRAEFSAIKSENEDLKVKLELASQNEEGAEAIVMNPENKTEVSGFQFSKNKTKSIQDSVYSKMFN
jgi:hypothetical protein